MRIGQTSVIVFGSKLISRVFGFIVTLYIARVLGAEILGQFALAIALTSWIVVAGELGVSDAIVKRISEGTDQSAYAIAGTISVVLFAGILSIGLYFSSQYVQSYIGQPVTAFVIFISFAVLLNSIVSSILRGQHKVHLSGVFGTVTVLASNGLQVGLVIAGFGLTGMLIGHGIGLVIGALLGILYCDVKIKIPELHHFKNIYGYAKYSWLSGIRARTFNQVDIVLLGFFVSSSLVGVYSISWGIAAFLMSFDAAISQAIFPEISRVSSEDDPNSIAAMVTDALRYSGLLLIPGLVGGSLLGGAVLNIYGPEFRQGSSVLALLILSTLFMAYQNQLLTTLNAINRPDLAFRTNLTFVVANVIGNLLLISTLGWVGAAIATVLSALIGLLISYHYVRRHIDISIPFRPILYQLLSSLLMGGLIQILRQFRVVQQLAGSNLLTTLILVFVGASVYFSLLFTMSREFRETIYNNLSTNYLF